MLTPTLLLFPSALLAATALVAVTAVIYRNVRAKQAADRQESVSVLRHTIAVNLSILKAEHTELSALAKSAESSSEVTAARALLVSVHSTAQTAEGLLNSSSKQTLLQTLTDVFQAMNQSTRARHLLGAWQSDMGE